MNNPKISVIVPVYNVEKYLSKCIESILAQTFTDFELLLVDDGSTDGSGEICDEYAGKDVRVKVFHTENRGVSAARNLGIREASADWICFVDSDDWVEETYLSDLYCEGFSLNESIVCQRVYIEHESCPEKNMVSFIESDVVLHTPFSGEQILRYEVLDELFVFAKIFNKKLIEKEKIKFREDISISEDVTFLRTYLQYVKEIRLCSSFSYHYMKRDIVTLSNRKHSSEEWLRVSDAIMEANIGLLSRFPKLDVEYVKKVFTLNGLLQLYFACINVNEDNYFSIFSYVRSKKHLFDKYFFSFNFEQRLFKSLFFIKWIPYHLIFFVFKIYLRLFK